MAATIALALFAASITRLIVGIRWGTPSERAIASGSLASSALIAGRFL